MDNFVSISKMDGYEDISSEMSSSIEEVGGMKLTGMDKVLIRADECKKTALIMEGAYNSIKENRPVVFL